MPTALVCLLKPLILSTTGVRSVPMKSKKSFNRKRKGAVYGALAASTNGASNTVVSIVHAAAYRAQLVHNEEVREIETD